MVCYLGCGIFFDVFIIVRFLVVDGLSKFRLFGFYIEFLYEVCNDSDDN